MNLPPPSEPPLPPTEPPPPALLLRLTRLAVSLGLGLLVGVLGHYLIYRLSLPSKPFIYVAF
jgi:ABC-type Mn2+/Zn2+ transport system permease subunit